MCDANLLFKLINRFYRGRKLSLSKNILIVLFWLDYENKSKIGNIKSNSCKNETFLNVHRIHFNCSNCVWERGYFDKCQGEISLQFKLLIRCVFFFVENKSVFRWHHVVKVYLSGVSARLHFGALYIIKSCLFYGWLCEITFGKHERWRIMFTFGQLSMSLKR